MSKALDKRVESIVEEEFKETISRIGERIRPLLVREMDRLKLKYPEIKKVIIGNGDWVFVFEPSSALKSKHVTGMSGLPRDFQRIGCALDRACDWRVVAQLLDEVEPTPSVRPGQKQKTKLRVKR